MCQRAPLQSKIMRTIYVAKWYSKKNIPYNTPSVTIAQTGMDRYGEKIEMVENAPI